MNAIVSYLSSTVNTRGCRLRIRAGACLLLAAGLFGGAGCDKLPWPEDPTKTAPPVATPAPAPKPAPTPPPVVQQPPTPTPPPKPPEPEVPVDDQILAEFKATAPPQLNDHILGKLAEMDDEHRAQIGAVNLNANIQVSVKGFQALHSLPNLKSLSTDQVPIKGKNPLLQEIVKMTELESLSLQRTAIDDNDLALLLPLQNLHTLSLDGTHITDAGFVHLANLRSLIRLHVPDCAGVSGAGFFQFGVPKAKHPGLKVIVAHRSRFGLTGFQAIFKSKNIQNNLEELYVGGSQVSDKQLEGLKTCKKLRVLTVGHDPITDYGMSLVNFRAKPELQSLVIDNAKGVTDVTLGNLKSNKKLKNLQVTGTSVTRDGIERLRKLLKNDVAIVTDVPPMRPNAPDPIKPRVILSAFADEAANSKSAVEQLAVLAALGLEYYSPRFVNVTGAGDVKNVMLLSKDEQKALKKLHADYGVSVASIGSPIGKVKLLDVDDGSHNRFVPFDKYLKNDVATAIDRALFFETKLIRGFSFYHPRGTDPWKHVPQAVDQLSAIVEKCRAAGVIFGLEVEANLIGQNGRLLAELARRVRNPHLLCIFDGGNLTCQNMNRLETLQELQAMKKYLGWMHVKDYAIDPSLKWTGAVDEERLKNFVPCNVGDAGHESLLRELKPELPALEKKLQKLGAPGVFLELEPHLKGGGQFGGFSGPDGLGVACRALCSVLDYVGIGYELRSFESIRRARGF